MISELLEYLSEPIMVERNRWLVPDSSLAGRPSFIVRAAISQCDADIAPQPAFRASEVLSAADRRQGCVSEPTIQK
jgi:hypothetical protein